MGPAAEGAGPAPDLADNRSARRITLAGYAGDEQTARAGLRHTAGTVRAASLGALARMNRLTVTDLADALLDPVAAVRRRACELSVGCQDADPRPMLTDPEPLVVEAAAWAAGERGDQSAVNDLARVATDHADPLCREAAVAALGSIGDSRGLPAILAGLTDRPAVRRRAVIALAPFQGPAVDAALDRAREDRDWQVRQAAEDLLDAPADG